MSTNELVDVRGAAFGYGAKTVVSVEALSLHRGKCLGIFGPNGAGKTTLVRGITGLLAPLSGNVTHASDLRFGYLPQHRGLDLHWPMSGFDAAALAASAYGRFGWLSRDARARVTVSMQRLDAASLGGRSFPTLSGGQQQRLLLAGALAADPQVLVLDEPTDGLDVRSRRVLLDLIKGLTVEGLCTAIISHEVEDLQYLSDSVAWLHPAEDPEQPSWVEVAPPSAERFGWHKTASQGEERA